MKEKITIESLAEKMVSNLEKVMGEKFHPKERLDIINETIKVIKEKRTII